MRTLATIFRKELRGFFFSPFGWVVFALVSVMQGWSMSGAMKALEDAPIRESLVYIVFHMPHFWFYFLFIFPLITMRLFAEEERAGTLETFLTAPVQPWQLVLGKYLATLTFYSSLWIPAFIQFQLFPLITDVPAPFTAGALFGAFFLLLLMGALFIAVGCLASALTSSQIIAGVVTIGLLVIHYFLGYVTLIYSDRFPAAPVFRYVASNEHLRYFTKGLVDSRAIVYYLTAALFFLFLTHHVLNHRRWRL